MKEVRSFSLDSFVAAAVDNIPRNERSRRINEILREVLLGEKSVEDVSIGQIKQLLEKIIEERPKSNIENEFKTNQKALDALQGIIGIREK